MTPEEEQFLKAQEAQMQAYQTQASNSQVSQAQQSMMIQEAERGMIKDQLDLSEEMEKIEHLLRGDVIGEDENGNRTWLSPEDDEMVLLTEYGIHLILNTITWYINKNTLLSNYEDSVINQKMEDFATSLSDTIFMEYEKVFKYPSFEDCKKILDKRIEYKVKLKSYAYEIIGEEADEKKIKKDLIKQLEGQIEEEINKIKEQIIKNKLKRFDLLLRVIQDSVHSTYLRAWKGQERRTLREHVHITESKGGMPPQQNNQQWSPFNFLGRKH